MSPLAYGHAPARRLKQSPMKLADAFADELDAFVGLAFSNDDDFITLFGHVFIDEQEENTFL